MLEKLRAAAHLERHVPAHPPMIRHAGATLLPRNGADIRGVREVLGDASIATTQRPTHVSKQHPFRASASARSRPARIGQNR